MARNLFSSVRANKPKRHLFDLSHDKKFDCDMGQLIPICAQEMVPGDLFKISCRMLLRFQPLVSPVMHNIWAKIWYFFVPYRLLDENFVKFITNDYESPEFAPSLARWNVSNNAQFSLWDYFGFPTGVKPSGKSAPLDFPRRAYNMIWNEYFRDENLQDEVELSNESILYKNWSKDYFTSALPWQQRGDAPAFPISGNLPLSPNNPLVKVDDSSVTIPIGNVYGSTVGSNPTVFHSLSVSSSGYPAYADLSDVTADLSESVSFDFTDVRYVGQIQRWMELNARFGVRYTEFLRGHYGVSPRDDRLQRPEFVGSCTAPIVISEVLQTSATDSASPQANMAGHGISSGSGRIGNYFANEFGILLGLLCIMPDANYQNGIERQWLRSSYFDFYNPAFAYLSEQEVFNEEIYAQNDEDANLKVFGFQGRYDEMRTAHSFVCGSLRSSLDYWHLGREFEALPGLNSDFITCKPRKDIFAVQDQEVPGLIVDFGNVIKAYRPLPARSMPGLIDHVYGG